MEFSALETLILSRQDREQGAGASNREIGAAERILGLNLTGGYRRFLERFGWLGIGPLEIYGVGAGVPKHMNLVDITQSERTEMRPRLQRKLVPVMNDGGGNLYCIDTSSRADGDLPVIFWDHELDADQEPEQISPSFEEWLYERLRGA